MSSFFKAFMISMMTVNVWVIRGMITPTQTQSVSQAQTQSQPPSQLHPKGDAGLASYQLGTHQPVFSAVEPNKTVDCRYEYTIYYYQAPDGQSVPYVRRFEFPIHKIHF